MANTIKHKRGSGSDPSASDLVAGELAIRTDNGAVFTKKDDGTVVQVTGASVGGANGVDFNDDVKARFGTGNDLEIYHNGSDSYVADVGTGNLTLLGSRVLLKNAADNERMLDATENGDVKIFYDDSQKLATKSDGIDVTGEVQCDSLDVDGSADISSSLNVSGNATFHGNVDLHDNDLLRIGSGDDLQIYHDGSNSYIKNNTGVLRLHGTEVQIKDEDNNETLAVFNPQGSVDLYYDNAKKLATKSDGIDVTGEVQCDSLDVDGSGDISGTLTLHGNLDMQDSDRIRLGSSDDLDIYHDGTNSRINNNNVGSLVIKNEVNDQDIVLSTDDGSGGTTTYLRCDGSEGQVQLTHLGTTKLNTKSDGVLVSGELESTTLDVNGAGDISGNLTIGGELNLIGSSGAKYMDVNVGNTGTFSIRGTTGGDTAHSFLAQFQRGGPVTLYNNGAVRLTTQSYGVDVTGEVQCDSLDVDGSADISGTLTLHSHLDMQDNDQIKLGSSDDYGIYHDGSNTYLDNYTGSVVHRVYADNQDIVLKTDNGSGGIADYLRCDGSEGKVLLYYYGSQKFQTKSDGIDVTGEVQCDSLDVDGVGNFSGDVVFEGGASAVTIGGSSDIRFVSGNWTGESTKLQHHSNYLYMQGGSNGIIFRSNAGTDRAQFNANGHFIPAQNNTYDLGTTNNQWRDAHFDGEVNCDGLAVAGNATVTGNLDINAYIRHNGDTNTYIGFPSTDTFRVVTNNVERFRITSTGAIAIEGSSNYGTSGQVLTSNGNDAPSWQDAAGGKILQVVGSTQLSAPSNTTSTSTLLYNATTVSITPTASSSKILFMYSQGVQVDVDNDGQGANNGLIQFEYKIGSGSYTSFLSHRISARGGNNMSSTDIVTVSPNTTSTVTFRVGIRKHEGSRAIAYTNIFGANAITLMEIAG